MSGQQKFISGILVLIGLLVAGAALAEPRTALVIGNAAYADSPLPNPVNDARDMARALQGMGFTVMLRENLEKRAMEEAISEFSDRLRQSGGVGLFFFNGHGAQVDEHNYLVPIGATIHSRADIAYETVDAGRLLDQMEAAGNGFNIIILDACRANPFGHSLPPAMGGTLSLGLAPMDAPAGSIIAYATSPGKVAESSYNRNSPYTAALLAEMSIPGHSIEQVFKQVRNRVKQATNNRQTPWEATSLMGDFYFVKAHPTPPAPPAPPPDDTTAAQVFHDTLKDGSQGPEMVALRGGRFLMGSPADEKGREKDERRHEVPVAGFAIGKYEVTVGQFESFVKATHYETETEKSGGCFYIRTGSEWERDIGKTWHNPGFSQTDEHPVVCVSWNDAMAYAEWLSQQTGKTYRLPTEAEWEYAARAGTTTARYWGDDINKGCSFANGADQTLKAQLNRTPTIMECQDGYVYPAPVGRFRPNAWGLYDMLGNVSEWTCSGYDGNYDGTEQRCISDKKSSDFKVVRGGSWANGPYIMRGAERLGYFPHFGDFSGGFRVARTLP